MATLTVDARLQQRCDTLVNWSAKNPILLVGEIGIASDVGMIKVGNGLSTWNSLAYIGITTDYLNANYLRKNDRAVSANYAIRFDQSDTRDSNESPQFYMTSGRGRVLEFKHNAVMGIPASQLYSQVCTIVPWQDTSGGYPVQISISTSGIFKRNAISETEWATWVQVSESEITT